MINMDWINDYVDLKDVDLKELADKITSAGINVEAIENNKIDNLVIGEIKSVKAHPDSDHLNVCMVDIGSEVTQIVCGASNVREGLKVIVALEGAVLPGDFVIKKSTIRGVESNGMMCALYELGLEEKTKERYDRGIEELPIDAKVGEDYSTYAGLNDVIYKLDLNPNRAIDCTNHIGFSYEVAAVLNKKVNLPETNYNEIDDSINNHFSLEVDTDKCKYYTAKMVTDVVIKESPDFIKRRLTLAGMRPINNVVDISNYVMLEFGQPLHFFDKDKLGDKILVRMANLDEKIVTLDGKERVLKTDDIVITDSQKPICIAGVMGGENTEVDNNTKNILIESAIFEPLNVRYTSINLDLRSESSVRYERGLNYEYTLKALNRACYLLEKYADAKILKDTVIYDELEKQEKVAKITKEKINKVLGVEIDDENIKDAFDRLGFNYKYENNEYVVTIPNRRLDVSIKEDLIEEVGRLYGYDKIESKLPTLPTKRGGYSLITKYRKDISKRLRSLNLNEVRTYTLVSEEETKMFDYDHDEFIKLDKPMSLDKSVCRRSLIPSLLKVVDYNKARGLSDIMIYEISTTYFDLTKEEIKLGIVMMGNYVSTSWQGKDIKVDFYLMKGILENLLDYLGLNNRYSFVRSDNLPKEMHPKMSAEIIVDGTKLGYFGRVHPKLSKDDKYVLELNLSKLFLKKTGNIKYKEVSKYPSSNLDLAFVTKKDTDCKVIMDVIKKASGKLLTNIEVFDVYVGENVKDDEKSIAFKLTFSDMEHTLNNDEVTTLMNKIIADVENKTNSKLRN